MYYQKICEHCGKQFTAQKSNTRFCSKGCADAANKERLRNWTQQVNQQKYDNDARLLISRSSKEEFSYIRRFILSYKTKEGDCRYVLGPRNAMSSLRQLSTLLSDGRLQDDTQHLKALRSKFNDIKGKAFNEDVRLFLKKQTNLKVWDWEVTIDVDGNLKAEENYGDIDVLAYDSVRKILFAIECKNTEKARNVKEMKTELDKYFGQPGSNKKGYIQKHIDRHQWLNNNINQVKSFVGEDPEFSIVSIILTSEVIPLSYISKIQPQLPILAFSQLKSKGVDSLIM